MTKPIQLDRQPSSTAGSSNGDKATLTSRSSSVDDRDALKPILDSQIESDLMLAKRKATSNDADSGAEDLDQQIFSAVDPDPQHDDNENDDEGQKQERQQEPSATFTACDDEGYEEHSAEPTVQDAAQERVRKDLALAANVPNEEKKEFCRDTQQVFHAEFARLILWVIRLEFPLINYALLTEDDFGINPNSLPDFHFVKLDNAKAQFKCPCCLRLWTSMRARISFKVSYPHAHGFVALKIYGQNCQDCNTPADALWYTEEVCRVMKNLRLSILEAYFPMLITRDDGATENSNAQTCKKGIRNSKHDPEQRNGKMRRPHDRNNCEACRSQYCFISTQ